MEYYTMLYKYLQAMLSCNRIMTDAWTGSVMDDDFMHKYVAPVLDAIEETLDAFFGLNRVDGIGNSLSFISDNPNLGVEDLLQAAIDCMEEETKCLLLTTTNPKQ